MSETAELTSNGRTLIGVVVADVNDKTIGVEVERRFKHPLYGKYIRRTKKMHVHDPKNECNKGDVVMIRECRPISKLKTWVLDKILEKAAS